MNHLVPLIRLAFVLSCWLILWQPVCAEISSHSTQASDDLRMVDGLRSRQLYRLAEAYAAKRVVEAGLTDKERAEIAAAWIRTYAIHALNSPPAERALLWKAADSLPVKFAKFSPRNPRLILVRLQSTLGLLARGELARQEAEVQAAGGASIEEARTYLRTCLGQLLDHKNQVAILQRAMVQGPNANSDKLSLIELTAITHNIEYQQARAYMNQGLCYPPQSPDRTNSLLQALALLKPLTQHREDSPSMWPSRLAQIRCQRLLARFDESSERINALLKLEPPVDVQLAARAQQVRLLLDQQKLYESAKITEFERMIDGQTSADLDYALFETYVALWKDAETKNKADDLKLWQAKAAVVAKQLDSLHGAYWSRRAEMTLTDRAVSGDSANVDLLIKTAAGFYRQDRLADALKTYDKAYQAALKADATSDQLFQIGSTAAAVALNQDDYAGAAGRFRELALKYRTHKDAARIHLTAAHALTYSIRRQDLSKLALYQEILEENLTHWPGSSVANQANFWLGKLYASQKLWSKATKLLMQVRSDYPKYHEVIQLTRQTALQQLALASSRNGLVEQDAARLINFFEQLILKNPGATDGVWSPTTRTAAETAAELWIHYGKNGYANAEAVIGVALKENSNPPQDWLNRLQSLLVIAQAGQGQSEKAQQTLSALSGGSPQKLMQLLDALAEITSSSPEKTKPNMANLQAMVIRQITPLQAQLSPEEQLKLKLTQVHVLNLQGERATAVSTMKKLAAANLKNQTIQIEFAELLSSGTTKEDVTQALAQWRYMANKTPPKSAAWYQAKYEIARSHFRLGNKEEASKVIRYMQTLHPNLGGPARKSQFETLLKLIDGS
ncbi:MAG: hypothetical protein COA78_02465 [Blastopirellula sp.]|nr:MAG: hypothetical protein COA78_02465 [Blastopirellula sp.]